MSSNTSLEQSLQVHPVCDLCHSRKVRCDRRQPCGNCQDAKTVCSRRRTAKRLRRNTSRQERESSGEQILRSLHLQTIPEPEVNLPAEVPVADRMDEIHGAICHVPLYDAQLTIQHHLQHLQGLTLDRRQVLESALRVPRQLLDDFGDLTQWSVINHQIEEQQRVPSAELLTWMLKDIESDRFGPFVADYFRHVSKPTLKHMGLALLRREISSHNSILFTICLNAMAFKFHTTMMNMDNDSELLPELQQTALQYRETAKAALHKIPMLLKPSLALLQALLCGIFLHQGSGDVTFCWELTKAACRTCIDLGLDTTAVQGGRFSEEEYYCFIWCYMLDRNYAFKLGRTCCFLDVELPSDLCKLLAANRRPMAELLLIYVDLARVQGSIIPYLQSRSLGQDQNDVSPLHSLKGQLLQQMQNIHGRIDQIASLPRLWTGMDIQTEVSALKFAYYSIMTAIFQVFETSDIARKPYLQSARQELSALVSMCLSAEKQSIVAFLHWTILYYPLTAYFVLFCNVVATSDTNDFNLMKAIADCLGRSGTFSRPISQLQILFQKFLSLSSGFLNVESESNTRGRVQDVQIEHQAHTPPTYPVPENNVPLPLPWIDNNLVLNQAMLAGMDDYLDTSNSHETCQWPFLAFNDSVSSFLGDGSSV